MNKGAILGWLTGINIALFVTGDGGSMLFWVAQLGALAFSYIVLKLINKIK